MAGPASAWPYSPAADLRAIHHGQDAGNHKSICAMRLCLQCQFSYARRGISCPKCGFAPPLSSGYPAYAPDLAMGGQGFREEFFIQLARVERGHFWFSARAALIVWALQLYRPGLESFFDIGCGTGYNLTRVARDFPHARLFGSELIAAGMRAIGDACPSVELMQMDARRIPFVDEFDAIGAFDVLEHIEEDRRVLSQMHAALRPGGIALLTVPQHKWLWSAVDAHSCHVRRYGSRELQQKVREAGFTILRSTSFVFLPLPGLLLSRMLRHSRTSATSAEMDIPATLNSALAFMLRLERLAIRAGLDLPLGGSRLVVARKPAPRS